MNLEADILKKAPQAKYDFSFYSAAGKYFKMNECIPEAKYLFVRADELLRDINSNNDDVIPINESDPESFDSGNNSHFNTL